MIDLPPMPPAIEKLPRDERGYPVPWFVVWLDGKPEFRVADGEKLERAVRDELCWVCGERIKESIYSFVIGPMCAVNRNIAEPPQHYECSLFSVKACPFLSMPNAKRREANLPCGGVMPSGFSIRRNPGVAAIWVTSRYKPWKHENGYLFSLGDPDRVEWFAEGRTATREEVMASINSGLPILEDMARKECTAAVEELKQHVARAMPLLPA